MQAEQICDQYCTGCGACKSVCPQNAISMIEDQHGFLVPYVDERKCVDCGLCQKTCSSEKKLHQAITTYIAKHKTESVYKSSQSGGAFTALSDLILEKGGTVYGASLHSAYEIRHTRAATKEARDEMKGSKYAQSRVDAVYEQLAGDLQAGKPVLFVGTGCQVAGVLNFLNIKRINSENLLAVDILCHGVPSPKIWRDTIRYYEEKCGSTVSEIFLREPEENKRPIFFIKVGEKIFPDSIYRKLFYSNLALRGSCYHCEYAQVNRIGDITIGDAWGVEKANPEFNCGSGVSLIMINTEKGKKIERFLREKMNVEEVRIEDYLQECLQHSAGVKRNPSEFWNDYHSKPFGYIIEKYAKHNPFLNMRYILARIIRKIGG